MENQPLVSICIPNYNYARFLSKCLESVLDQTFSNYEVIFRDNASTDESYDVALSYRERFAEKGITYSIARNKYNLGSDRNSELCAAESKGKYLLILASDDCLYPDYLKEVMEVFQNNSNVSMVMVHRDEIDADGNIKMSIPFYNSSCIIPGEEQAAVFMMAGIAIPGQRVMKVSSMHEIKEWICTFQVANDWYYNALMACAGDVAYINKPLMQYRVHNQNETSESEYNLTGVLEHYQIIHKIAKVTSQVGYLKPHKRLPEAIEKLGDMCLRYAYKMLLQNEKGVAEQYLNLAKVFKATLESQDNYQELRECINLEGMILKERLLQYKERYEVERKVSYNPPENAQLF